MTTLLYVLVQISWKCRDQFAKLSANGDKLTSSACPQVGNIEHRMSAVCLSAAVADVNTTATNICAMKLKSVSEVTQKKACVNGNAIHGPSRKGSKPPQFANTTSAGKTTLCTTAVDAPSQFRFGTVASNDRTANVGS